MERVNTARGQLLLCLEEMCKASPTQLKLAVGAACLALLATTMGLDRRLRALGVQLESMGQVPANRVRTKVALCVMLDKVD